MNETQEQTEQLITKYFSDKMCILKSLSQKVSLGERDIPAFVSDWLISRYSDGKTVDTERVRMFLDRYLPDKKQKGIFLNKLLEGQTLKILDHYRVEIKVEERKRKLIIPFLDYSDGRINEEIVDENPLLLTGDVWGSGTLVQRQDPENSKSWKIWMIDFQPMQAAYINLDYFIDQRKYFSLKQWRELLVCSMGYDPEAYTASQQQLLLVRLVPMVQPRVNLIELAPRGTGKSYTFSQLSRHCWLISGGVVTRAQLFYDMKTRIPGVITRYDVVILDEIQSIKIRPEPEETVGALRGYLESGEFRVMQYHGTSDASFVILGNIPIKSDFDRTPKNKNYFRGPPKFLREAGLIDRFHGFVPGWELPRIEKRQLHRGYSLKADYFSEILHELRKRMEYMNYIREHTQSDGDIRDIRSIERIAAGFLKLLFPDLSLVTKEMFAKYCLEPAKQLRSIIRYQLHILDPEYEGQLKAKIEVV